VLVTNDKGGAKAPPFLRVPERFCPGYQQMVKIQLTIRQRFRNHDPEHPEHLIQPAF
jgi:hypothetical protein